MTRQDNAPGQQEIMPAEATHHSLVTLILPTRGTFTLNVAELWSYRELLLLFAWRDATVRYKQSFVGIGWAVIQPVLMMVIFSLIFGSFAKLPSGGLPYAVFTLCALVPWNYFARSLADSTNSVVGASHLITKIYLDFLLPLSRVLSGLIDFAIAFLLLIALMAWYRITPSLGALLLPLFLLMAMATALGMGLWLTALNIKYRDVGFVVPFLVQVWMYASPVAYSTSVIPARWKTIYALNPMVGVIDGFRWALLGSPAPDPGFMVISCATVFLLLFSGLAYFGRMERIWADII